MAQIFTNDGLGLTGSSIGRLGSYGPKTKSALGQGGESIYVNAANGNMVLRQNDGFLAGSGLGVDLVQSYNSRGERGHNWLFNIQTELIIKGVANSPGSEITRVDEDGHLSRFIYDKAKGYYVNEKEDTASLSFNNNRWSYREGASASCYEYDDAGLLNRIVDRDGHQLQFTYKGRQLESIIDNSGQQTIEWTFEQGLLKDILTISAGEVVHHLHYDYDESNRLRRVSRDLGEGSSYWVAYDYAGDSERICSIRQSDGSSLSINYDSEGRVKTFVDGEGRATSYDYFIGKTLITDSLGQTYSYFYDAEGRLTGIDSPLKATIRYEYQGNNLAAVHQGNLHWLLSYNEAGDCIQIEEPSGQLTKRIYDTEHRLINEICLASFDGNHFPQKPKANRFVYDDLGHLRFKITSDGTVTEYRYNQDGQCLSTRTYLKSGYDFGALRTDASLDLNDLLTWVRQQDPQDVSLKSFHYDWRGLLDEEVKYVDVDEAGEGRRLKSMVTGYHYDAAGRLREILVPTEKGFTTTTFLYDDLGRLIQRCDGLNNYERFEYDDGNQRIIETDAKGGQSIRSYDRSGLVLSTQYLDQGQRDYGTLRYRYDAAGRLQAESTVDGKETYYFYDLDGQLRAKCEPGGQLIEYCYDVMGRLVQTRHYQEAIDTKGWWDKIPDWSAIHPQTSVKDRINQTIYNTFNQVAYQIDGEGFVRAFRYDGAGQLIEKTAYAIGLTNIQTDQILSFDSILIQTSSEDRSYYYYYDSEGRLEAEINGEGNAKAYRYNRDGHLSETIRFSNRVRLPAGTTWEAPKVSSSDIHNFSLYNSAGLKMADIDPLGYVTTYEYDERGLLIRKCSLSTALKRGILVNFNAETTLTDLNLQESGNDHLSLYVYDELGRLIEQQDQNGLITRYRYDEKGLLLEKTLIDANTQELRQQRYRYDAMGRVIQSLDALGAAKLAQKIVLDETEIEAIWQQHGLRYDYDLAGRVICQTNALNQSTRYFYNHAGLLLYTINAEGEVLEQQYNNFKQVELVYRYANPLKGNIASLSQSEIASRLANLKKETVDEWTRFEYNQIGLVTKKVRGHAGQLTTTYNSFGEIEETRQSIDSRHQVINRYLYDHRGLLLQQISDAEGLKQVQDTDYDQFGRVIKTIDGNRGITNYILDRRGDCLIIENQARGRKLLSYDAFGRILTETDHSHSKLVNSYSYDDRNNTLTLEHPGINAKIETQFNAFGDKVRVIDGNGQARDYHYDVKGQLVKVNNPGGSAQDYNYDQQGNLILQQDAEGHLIAYSYDASGRVLSKTIDPMGLDLTTSYRYDSLGRQLEIIDAKGLHKQFSYDDNGNLIQVCVDPNGLNLVSSFQYDDRGLLIRQAELNIAGKMKVTAYEWDNLGRQTTVTIDPEGLGLTTHYGYDLNNNIISQTDAKNQPSYLVYDVKNQCRYQIDTSGRVTEHVYNENGNEIETIVYANRIPPLSKYSETELKAIIQASSNDHYQFYDFDNMGRLVAEFDSLGYATSYSYDANNNLIHLIRYAQAISLAVLKDGLRVLPKPDGARQQFFAYDGMNQLIYQLDEGRYLTQFNYDRSGQVISKIKFAIGVSLPDNCYSSEDISKAIQISSDDQYTAYAYDQAGRLSYQANADGAVTCYIYDSLGLVTASLRYATRLDPTILRANNWQTQLKKSDQDRMTRFVFDLAGREIYRISPEGRVLERRYDALGNVITEIAHDLRFDFKKDNEQDLPGLLSFDSTAGETSYDYDLAGRLEVKTDANHQKTSYRYDKNSNVTAKIEANSAQWYYIYDEANQLIETRSPMIKVTSQKEGWQTQLRSIVTQNVYDSFGNIIQIIRDAEGLQQTVNFVYDENNRKLATIYPNVAINVASNQPSTNRQEQIQNLKEEYQYNAFGELIATKDRAGNWRYNAYDNKGQLMYTLNAQGALIGYSYDAFGNLLSKISYANRFAMNNGSDFLWGTVNKAASRSDVDRTETYRYDMDNRLIETRKPSLSMYNSKTKCYDKLSPIQSMTYNAFGEVIENAVKRNEIDWAKTAYYYDKDGLKIACLDAEHYLSAYHYNNFGELIDEVNYSNRATAWDAFAVRPPVLSEKDRHVTFSYDSLGQLTARTLKNVCYEQLVGSSNRYESLSADLTTHYTYDALGNLTSTTDPLGFTAFCYYDALGQLITKVGPLKSTGRSAISYSYDGLGQLVETVQYLQGAEAATESSYLVKSSPGDIISRSIYDNQGKVLTTIDGLNHEMHYSYDANGQVERSWQLLSQADGSKRLVDRRYSYDKEGQLLQTSVYKSDGQLHTENTQYNLFGEIIAKGFNGTFTTHIDYDNLGRVRRSNIEGYYQVFLYDLSDKVTQIVRASNQSSPEYGVSGVDLSEARFDHTERFNEAQWEFTLLRQDNIYDELGYCLGQRIESAGQNSHLEEVSQTQTVDRWGNVLSHINALGYKTNYEYNIFDKLIKQELPEVLILDESSNQKKLKPTLYYAYDALGRVIALTDAKGHTLAKVLDEEGKVLAEIDAEGNKRLKTYNLLGQLQTSQNELNGLTTYFYDKANRLVSLRSPTNNQSYAYDEEGKLIEQRDALNQSLLYWYDNLGNQIQKRDSNGRITKYAYDAAGHKTFEQDANSLSQSWRYDEHGRLIEHSDLGGHLTQYQYNRNGFLLEEVSSAGKQLSYRYQGDGKLLSYTDYANKETAYYSYDADGNLVSRSVGRATQGKDNGWKRENDTYSYDALGRLTSVKRFEPDDQDDRFPDRDHQLLGINYSYDAAGNISRTAVEANYTGYQKVQSDDYYSYDANNRMLINKGQLNNGELDIKGSQSSRLAYDDAGNVKDAFKFENGQLQHYHYVYNSDSQLQEIYKNDKLLKTIHRDALGRVDKEFSYDSIGHATELTEMRYEGDLLKGLTKSTLFLGNWIEVERNEYSYDFVGNITSVVSQLVKNKIHEQSVHTYTYEHWDNYLQSTDTAALSINGSRPTFGENRQFYDGNGQLYKTIDNQIDTKGKSNSTDYRISTLEGIRSRIDASGERDYLTVAGKTIGDLLLSKDGVQQLNVYGGFTPMGKQQNAGSQSTFLSGGLLPIENASGFFTRGNEVAPAMDATNQTLANTPQDNTGTYSVQSGDNLQSIALQVYGDSSFWYLIADANGISDINDVNQLHNGQRLIIPAVAVKQHLNNGTHQKLSSAELLGDLSATVPIPESFIKTGGHKPNSLFKKIAIAAISMVATVIAAAACAALGGALGASLGGGLGRILSLGLKVLAGQVMGTAGSFAAGFAAGVTGNLVSQGLANILGLQKGVDLRSTLISGLSTATTSGLLQGLNTSQAYTSWLTKLDTMSPTGLNFSSAAQMMEQDAISQGVGLALQKHQHFNWLEFGTKAGLGALTGSEYGRNFNQSLTKHLGGSGGLLIQSELYALATNGMQAAAHGGHFDAAQVLTDNLGSAIGSSFINTQIAMAEEKAISLSESDVTTVAGEYCPIPEENFTVIPEGTYERFHQERAQREFYASITEKVNELWNDYGEQAITYGPKLMGVWFTGEPEEPENTISGNPLSDAFSSIINKELAMIPLNAAKELTPILASATGIDRLLQPGTGMMEMSAALELMAIASSPAVAFLGTLLFLNGTDNVLTGTLKMITGEPMETQTLRLLGKTPLPHEIATLLDDNLPLLANPAPLAVKTASKITKYAEKTYYTHKEQATLKTAYLMNKLKEPNVKSMIGNGILGGFSGAYGAIAAGGDGYEIATGALVGAAIPFYAATYRLGKILNNTFVSTGVSNFVGQLVANIRDPINNSYSCISFAFSLLGAAKASMVTHAINVPITKTMIETMFIGSSAAIGNNLGKRTKW